MSEINLGGGIWRLKWDPFYHKYLIAACMYGGFRLVDCTFKNNLKIIGEYNEHKSISYGCDWSHLACDDVEAKLSLKNYQKILVTTCSFYDHKLDLSSLNLNE